MYTDKDKETKGKYHYVSSNRDFTCTKCQSFRRYSWSDMKSKTQDGRYCSETGKKEYELNDGECPYSFNEYRILNSNIY